MGHFIKLASSQYDQIVFDTPPVINVTDAVVLCNHIHSAILVVRSFSHAKRAGEAGRRAPFTGAWEAC